jgi:hypothetical protein
MAEISWSDFDGGATVGQPGSERGVIVRDEEHSLGARITLERNGQIAPYAITCGIYGWMVHTRFFGLESDACNQYDLMKIALVGLLRKANEKRDEGDQALLDGIGSFVETYP